MDLFLIRHGQSANNVLIDAGQRVHDPGLTAVGLQQAAQLADFLARGGHLTTAERCEARYVDRVYCSPMLRALQTAEPVGASLGVQPEVWVELHEVGGLYRQDAASGRAAGYPGLTRTEMGLRFPDLSLPDAVTDAGWWDGGMESFHCGQGRAIGVAARLRDCMNTEERVVLVMHGGFGSCLLQSLGRQLPADIFHYAHGNTGITRLQLTPELPLIMRYANRLEHLPEELRT